MSFIGGLTFKDWLILMNENRFRVELPYWPRALFLLNQSLINSYYKMKEKRSYNSATEDVVIQSPIFILGHWRSGTTLLHNMITCDKQFNFPNLFQISNPNTFIILNQKLSERLTIFQKIKRPMDNIKVGPQSPGEDEFALAILSRCSPLLSWIFPKSRFNYDLYIDFRNVPDNKVTRWKKAFEDFLKKISWRDDRRLVLKSPAHTSRIRLLLKIFPDAKFIHICRNPYAVYQSTTLLYEKMVPSSCLQRPPEGSYNQTILKRYEMIYDSYIEDRKLLAQDQLCEIRFEDFENAKLETVRRIYDVLNISGFKEAEPALKDYVESISNYQKNVYYTVPESIRRGISDRWQRFFSHWRYDS